VIIRQKSDSNTHTDKEQGLVDSRLGDVRHSSDICEEIPEDAYKQNSVYQSWTNISPEEDKAASERKRSPG
jgi:hypothetical protein